MKKPRQDWRRPGLRVNVYFRDLQKLHRLDRLTRENGTKRAEEIMRAIDRHLTWSGA